MRRRKFTVHFKNGKKVVTYGGSIYEGIVQALAYALDKAYDNRIDKIYDETEKKLYNSVSVNVNYSEVKQ